MTALCKQHWLVHAHVHFVFPINLKSINDTLIQDYCSFYSMNHNWNFEKFLILKSLGNVSQAYCEGGRGVRHNVRGRSGGDGWGVQQQVRGGHTMHSGKVICAFMHSCTLIKDWYIMPWKFGILSRIQLEFREKEIFSYFLEGGGFPPSGKIPTFFNELPLAPISCFTWFSSVCFCMIQWVWEPSDPGQ